MKTRRKPRKERAAAQQREASAAQASPAARPAPFWPFGLVAFALLLSADQLTKGIISSTYALGESHRLLSWLSFTYVRNTGAPWGTLAGANAILAWLSVIAFGALVYFHDAFETAIEKVCYTLLLVGLWGNLIDRVARGFVVDFIDLHWWPVFNIADSAISVGIALFLIERWRRERAEKAKGTKQ